MNLEAAIRKSVKEAAAECYQVELPQVEMQPTRKDFEGDITVVIFPMLKFVKGNPVAIGEEIGAYLLEKLEVVSAYNVVKGFLNLVISDSY